MRTSKSCFSLLVIGFAMVFSSCNKQAEKEAAARTEQLQAQLDKTQKALEDLKAKEEQREATPPPPQAPPPKTAAATSTSSAHKTEAKPASSTASKSSKSVEADLAASKEAAKKAISEDRTAIAANKSEIAANRNRAEQAQAAADEAKRMAAPPPSHTIPAGTAIAVRTIGTISTKTAATGSIFEATLAEPLVVDGYTLAGRGATVEGVVTNADPGGRVKGVASITLGLRSLVADDGRRMPLRTDTVSQDASKSGKKDAARVGIATGIGAAIGAIAGGGRGAAIGAGAGAAGGTGVTLATRGKAAEIPSETVLNFTLASPIKFQELKR